MKALQVVFAAAGKVEVREEEVYDPEAGELQLQTTCSLISTGTECICLSGKFEAGTSWAGWVKYPFRPGYSLVGRVIKVGKDVKGFKEGDRVTCPHSHARCRLAKNARLIPDGVSDEEASWGTLAYITQHGFRKANVQLGDVVAVVGAGALGQLIVQYARAAGAGAVVAIDTAGARLEMACAHGATAKINKPVGEAVEELKGITGGRLADVVFDMTGHPAVFAGAMKLPRKFGKFVLVGDVAQPSEQRMAQEVIMRDITIMGCTTNPPPEASDWCGYWTQNHMVALFFEFLRRKQMRVGDLITHRYPLQEAGKAFEMLMARRGEAMGVVLEYR